MNKRTAVIAGVAGAAVVLAGIGLAVATLGAPPRDPSTVSSPASPEPTVTPEQTATPAPEVQQYDTARALRYVIEEEKLAHDVYVVLGATWGSNIFSNISDSETTHQALLLPLLEARGIADPRSTEVGVFADPNLQSLYDELIARGTVSLAEAMQVGILIEEKDIADLTTAIAAEDEADVVGAYQRLLAGSENHLASFERQV
ncbi:hypothetical protein BH11ACT4_BH11ACT4_11140 [soil metagenome]